MTAQAWGLRDTPGDTMNTTTAFARLYRIFGRDVAFGWLRAEICRASGRV